MCLQFDRPKPGSTGQTVHFGVDYLTFDSGILKRSMRVLYSILLIAFVALAGSITAVLLLIRRRRMRASDAALRRELEQIERENRSFHQDRS